MLSANGLYGHIRNNALKSAFLLTGFVVLMVVFWYSWCIIYTAIADVWWANFAQRRPRNPATVADILSKALELVSWSSMVTISWPISNPCHHFTAC